MTKTQLQHHPQFNMDKEIEHKFNAFKAELVLAQQKYGGVYIAQVSGVDGTNLEVEDGPDGSFIFMLKIPKEHCLFWIIPATIKGTLRDYLEKQGIYVYKDHLVWTAALAKAVP
jgi:hypothetical protein